MILQELPNKDQTEESKHVRIQTDTMTQEYHGNG